MTNEDFEILQEKVSKGHKIKNRIKVIDSTLAILKEDKCKFTSCCMTATTLVNDLVYRYFDDTATDENKFKFMEIMKPHLISEFEKQKAQLEQEFAEL